MREVMKYDTVPVGEVYVCKADRVIVQVVLSEPFDSQNRVVVLWQNRLICSLTSDLKNWNEWGEKL